MIQFSAQLGGRTACADGSRIKAGCFSYSSSCRSGFPRTIPCAQNPRTRSRGFERVWNHTFRRLYSHEGRPSIPPEQLLNALILQVLYSVRSERQLMEQLDYNLLFRWFVGLSPDDPIWNRPCSARNGNAFKKPMCSRSS